MYPSPHRTARRGLRRGLATAAVLGLVTTLAACGGQSGAAEDGKVTLTVATFNEFGYEELFDQYMEENPDVAIEHRKVGTWDEARDALYTKLAAGSGLADIEAIEGDGMPALLEEEGIFNDLSDPEVEGRWPDWKTAGGTNADGELVGYGTDAGPEGICYRRDLFEQAGLPTDRDEVAELFVDWDTYFDTGREFVEAMPGTAWYDASKTTSQAMLNQLEAPFEDPDGTVTAAENPELREVYDTITANRAEGLSTGLDQWVPDWVAAFGDDAFATMACPPWMLGVIEGNAEGVEGWDIANAFPGGGGNWGGSYLSVPTTSEHPEEARELAAWLTAPEQQIVAFEAKGPFPSQVEALDDEALTGQTNAFFNDAPTGEIFTDRSEAIAVQPYKGPHYADLLTAFQAAILRVDQGQQTPEESWEAFVGDAERIG